MRGWRLKSPASRLFTQPFIQAQSKKTSKLRVTGLWGGNSPVTGEFPTQCARNAENVSITWHQHEKMYLPILGMQRRLDTRESCIGHTIPKPLLHANFNVILYLLWRASYRLVSIWVHDYNVLVYNHYFSLTLILWTRYKSFILLLSIEQGFYVCPKVYPDHRFSLSYYEAEDEDHFQISRITIM